MRVVIANRIDRRLQRLVVARARHRAPLLELVPAPWIVVVARPQLARLRRTVHRSAAIVTTVGTAALVCAAIAHA